MTGLEFYYWSTDEEHANNEVTMSDFLNNELSDDYEILFVDGTYAEIQDEAGCCWAVHASGDGDFRKHKVQFASAGFSYVNIVGDQCKGWLNLFFGEMCVAMINDVELADKIRETTQEKK